MFSQAQGEAVGGRGVLDKDRYSREEESLNMAERQPTQTRVYYGPGLNMGYTYRDAGWGCPRGLKTDVGEGS